MKINTTFKIKINELLFFMAYGLFLFFSVLSTSLYYKYFSGAIFSVILLMCIGVLCLSEVITLDIRVGKTRKRLIATIIAAVIYTLISYSSGSLFTTIGLIPFLLFSARKIEFKKIVKFSVILIFILFLFIIFSSMMHILPNIIVNSASGRRREFLGFRFPLNAPTLMFNITALWLYYRQKSITIWEIIVLCAINVFLFQKTDSKLSFILSIALIMICWLLKYCEGFLLKRKSLTFLLASSFIIAFILSLICALSYDSGKAWMRSLNRLTEDRLYFANYSLEEYGVTLFGEDIPWVGYGLDDSGNIANGVYAQYFYVDNMYIQIMQRYGLIFISFYLVLNTLALFQCRKTKDLYLLMIVAIIAMRCIVDNLSFYLYYNSFWFIISYELLYRHKITDSYVWKTINDKIHNSK